MALLGILGMVIGLASLVCFIMVLIKQFQNGGAVQGIIGLVTCGIWTLIWGWINSGKLNIQTIMMVWTGLIILGIILNVVGGGMAAINSGTPVTP